MEYIPICMLCIFFLIAIVMYRLSTPMRVSSPANIPKVIHQTYKHKDIPPVVRERWMSLNPEYTYRLYDDDDCYKMIHTYYGPTYADFFKNHIKDGPIKSDFWRVCMLYQFGGIYADIDILPKVPIREFLDPTSTLYTCITDKRIDRDNLNPHFIATIPKNPLIRKCIEVYMNEKRHKPYDYWEYSIVGITADVLRNAGVTQFTEGTHVIGDQQIQLSQEVCSEGGRNTDICYIQQGNRNLMYNRDPELYDKDSHSFRNES